MGGKLLGEAAAEKGKGVGPEVWGKGGSKGVVSIFE